MGISLLVKQCGQKKKPDTTVRLAAKKWYENPEVAFLMLDINPAQDNIYWSCAHFRLWDESREAMALVVPVRSFDITQSRLRLWYNIAHRSFVWQ